MAIVFFDYDGTLVDEKVELYNPTETTLKAIRQLQKNGHYAVLATGRAKCYIPDKGIKWDGIISSNGAYAEISGKAVYNKEVSPHLVSELVERADELGYSYALENQDLCFTNGFHDENFMRAIKFFDISTENFRPIEEADRLRANKMLLAFSSMEQFDIIRREFEGKFHLGSLPGNIACDCDSIGSNKAVGIAHIANAVGVDISETYAFGDGINDYEMLKTVGHGIAMGNHRIELDEVAEFITETVVNEGIEKGLKKYCLI